MKIMKVALATLVLVAGTIAPAGTSSAHHFVDRCGEEVGIWTKSASARQGIAAYEMKVDAYVGYYPGFANCTNTNGTVTYTNGTQHTALHARRGTECVETVAIRNPSQQGYLTLTGYDCRTSGNVHFIQYAPDWITLWQATGNTGTTWSHWYWRWDTSSWVFLGNTARSYSAMYTWFESSGYNGSVARQAKFRGLTERRPNGTYGSTNFPCPETEDFDAHQKLDPTSTAYAGNADFVPASNAQDNC